MRLHVTQDVSSECITVPILVHYYEHSSSGHHAGGHVNKEHIDLYVVDDGMQITMPKHRICVDGSMLQSADANDVLLVTDAHGYENARRCFSNITPTTLTQFDDLEPFRSLMYRIELASKSKVIKSYAFRLRELYIHHLGVTLHMTDIKSGVPFTMMFNELVHRASCGVRCRAVDRWAERYEHIDITDTGALRIDASFKAIERFMQLLEFERRFEEGRKR
jgi:hypothetical protein